MLRPRLDTGDACGRDERSTEIIAALKIRTANKKGRHLSTACAIRLLENGVETPEGLGRAPTGLLKRATVQRQIM